MAKKKRFRRVNVSNRGYVSGKRLQVFRAYKKQQKAPGSVSSTAGSGVEHDLTGTGSASKYNEK